MMQEKTADIVLFVQRLLVSAALIYLTTGQALYFGAFAQNAAALGIPYAGIFCLLLIVCQFVCSFLILTGIAFRYANFIMAALCIAGGVLFFAGNFDKIAVVSSLLALALFIGFMISGPGIISLQYLIKKLKERKNKNRLPRH